MPPPRGSRFVLALRFQQKRRTRVLISLASGPTVPRGLLALRSLLLVHRVLVVRDRQPLAHRAQVAPLQMARLRALRLGLPQRVVLVAAEHLCRLPLMAKPGVMPTSS
jgi:hypothetical protein